MDDVPEEKDVPEENDVPVEKDEEWWRKQAAAEQEWWARHAAEHEEQFIRQNGLMHGGLIAIGIVMVQPFLTAPPVDLTGKICVTAFSVAIPLLAALIVLNHQETYRRRASKSKLVGIGRPVAQASAFVGMVAGFWHILPLAGVGVLVAGVLGMAIHSAGYVRLERGGAALEEQDADESQP